MPEYEIEEIALTEEILEPVLQVQNSIDRYEILRSPSKRVARSTGRDFSPIIENPSTKGREDFQDFRQFQSNLNKNQDKKSGSAIRSKRSTGRDFNPIIESQTTKGREDFDDFRKFQSNLNKNQPTGIKYVYDDATEKILDTESSLKRIVRSDGRDFSPIIENPNTKGRDDFQDFRQFQSNLNKKQAAQSNSGIRFRRDLGDNFTPVIEMASNENIMRNDFQNYRNFQAELSRRDQEKREEQNMSVGEAPESTRVKRMLVFRPLFVYKNQQYKRKRLVKEASTKVA